MSLGYTAIGCDRRRRREGGSMTQFLFICPMRIFMSLPLWMILIKSGNKLGNKEQDNYNAIIYYGIKLH